MTGIRYKSRLPVALLKYSTGNLGDDLQTLAVMRLLGQPEHFVDREDLASASTLGRILLVLNGWFGPDTRFDITPNVNPLFLGFHLSRGVRGIRSELSRHQPIGCRDRDTLERLRLRGIRAFHTSCMTLTFDNDQTHRNGGVYMVDVHDELQHLIPAGIRRSAKRISHFSVDAKTPLEERFRRCEELLDRYAGADLVVTSLLHCALPCLALNTPVVFLHRQPHAPRLLPAKGYIRIWGPDDDAERISFEPEPPSVGREAERLKRFLAIGLANGGDFDAAFSEAEKWRLGVASPLRRVQSLLAPFHYALGALQPGYKRDWLMRRLGINARASGVG